LKQHAVIRTYSKPNKQTIENATKNNLITKKGCIGDEELTKLVNIFAI
jgi:hypothetical protein